MPKKHGAGSAKPKRSVRREVVVVRPRAGGGGRLRRAGGGGGAGAPVAVSTVTATREPRITADGRKCAIRHREYVTDIVSSLGSAGAYSANVTPTNGSLFRWLAGVADKYEKFEFKSLTFMYVPKCSSTSAGTVSLALDYDPDDAAASDKPTFLAMAGATSGNVWNRMQLAVNRVRLGSGERFTAGLADPPPKKTTSIGSFQVWVDATALPAYTPLGEIWVEYEVVLSIPQTGFGIGGPVSIAQVRALPDVGVPMGGAAVVKDELGISGGTTTLDGVGTLKVGELLNGLGEGLALLVEYAGVAQSTTSSASVPYTSFNFGDLFGSLRSKIVARGSMPAATAAGVNAALGAASLFYRAPGTKVGPDAYVRPAYSSGAVWRSVAATATAPTLTASLVQLADFAGLLTEDGVPDA